MLDAKKENSVNKSGIHTVKNALLVFFLLLRLVKLKKETPLGENPAGADERTLAL